MLNLLFRLFRSPKAIPAKSSYRLEDLSPEPLTQTSRPSPPTDVPTGTPKKSRLSGKCYVIDGDTIVIGRTHIRLAGIDAPEIDDPWGKKAKFAMVGLCKGKIVTAELKDETSYDRVVAKCFLPDGTDLSAALVEQGLALDWRKFSGGAYRHLEPAGARKKMWRVAAKHQGRLNTIYKPTQH